MEAPKGGDTAANASKLMESAKTTAFAAKDTVVGATGDAVEATKTTAVTAKDTVVGATNDAVEATKTTAVSAKDTVLGAVHSATEPPKKEESGGSLMDKAKGFFSK